MLEPIIKKIKESGRVDILLERRVLSVDYTFDCASVEVLNLKTNMTEIIHGDMIVSTVSVGVILNNRITFNPPLPTWKWNAINSSVEMGTYLRIYLTFHHQFWPDGIQVFYLAGAG